MFERDVCTDHCLERIIGALKEKNIHFDWDDETDFDTIVTAVDACFERGSYEHRDFIQIAFIRNELKIRGLKYSADNLKSLLDDPDYHTRFHDEYERKYGKS